jgi:hypothetical protein
MNGLKSFNARRLSVAGFSFLFAYILSFQFEGQVLYSLLDLRGTDAGHHILTAIIAHFVGLFTCGLFVKSQAAAKSMMLGGMGIFSQDLYAQERAHEILCRRSDLF